MLNVAFQNPNSSLTSSLSQSSDGTRWADNSAYDAHDAAKPEGDLGDVTMAADRAGSIFVGHLTQTVQADIDYSLDGGKTWQTAAGVTPVLGSSTSSFLVDRPWITAYSPDTNYKDTTFYLEFHDFGPSLAYVVSCSMATGSLQCGAPVPVSNLPVGGALSQNGDALAAGLLAGPGWVTMTTGRGARMHGPFSTARESRCEH